MEPKREAFKPNSFGAENDTRREWANKSHPRNHKTELIQFGFFFLYQEVFEGWLTPIWPQLKIVAQNHIGILFGVKMWGNNANKEFEKIVLRINNR